MTYQFQDYLAHHGVKGMRHGHRRWQNEDGSYTEAGKIHYGFGQGDGRQVSSSAKTNTQKKALTPEQKAQRRAKTAKVMGIAAGVAVAAAIGYGAYKGSTNLRNNYRTDYQFQLQKQGFYQDAAERMAKQKWNRRNAFQQFKVDRAATLRDIRNRKTSLRVDATQAAARNNGRLSRGERSHYRSAEKFLNSWEWQALLGRGVTRNRAVRFR